MTDTAASITPPPPREQTLVLRECAICQSSIYPAEATHPCPKCGLTFHAECWQENFGCASYGCDQVNALAPKIDIPSSAAALSPAVNESVEPLPWDYALLGVSALTMAMSPLCYGLPSALAACGVAWRMWRTRSLRNRILLIAAAISALGMVGGYFVSQFWFTHVDYTAGG
ncbi:MAG: hypothetical protein QOF78_957 [Phycisphaerales bacterium]|jgi:hypothetical protein|nr:hypothetical protein [Phycisphaerales bacterium]